MVFTFVIRTGIEYETRTCPTCQNKLEKNNYTCDKCGVWLHSWCGEVIDESDEEHKIVRCFKCVEEV